VRPLRLPLSSPVVVPVPIVMAMIVIVIVIVTAAVIVIAVMVMVVVVVVVGIPGYIAWFVFPRSHKVHRPIAGVVFLAMLAPILGVSRRHMQVHGGRWNALRHNQHRLRINERRRRFVAKLNLTVYAGGDLTR